MPVREIIGKSVAFGIVSLSCILGAVLVFYGPHSYNDYFNAPLGLGLGLIGVGVAAVGVIVIAGIIADARLRQREERLHITPRPGPAVAPPAWGMGDVGRPSAERGGKGGGGSERLMSVRVSDIDGPIVIGFLLLWTLVACIVGASR